MELNNVSGVVFDTQRYSIHDGPGIRTIIFLKGCPLRCPWCANPESQRRPVEIWYNKKICIGCGECIKVCPTGNIARGEDGLVIDFSSCNNCGKCAEACCSRALSTVGRQVLVQDMLEVIERDRAFYKKSGGGVTLSGGEPLMQSTFAAALLASCKERDISTAIETCGYAAWEDVVKVLPFTDLFLYDLKIFDTRKHQEMLGAGNERILSNLEKLIAQGGKAVVRVPLIPNFNDDVENLKGILTYAQNVGAEYVNILPYHRLGEIKYEKLGKTYTVKAQPQEEGEIRSLVDQAGDFDIPIVIGG